MHPAPTLWVGPHGLDRGPRCRSRSSGAAVSWVDPLVLLWVALAAVVGYGRGLVAQALSLVGLAIGAFVGSRLAPFFLADGKSSPWVAVREPHRRRARRRSCFQVGGEHARHGRSGRCCSHGPLRIATASAASSSAPRSASRSPGSRRSPRSRSTGLERAAHGAGVVDPLGPRRRRAAVDVLEALAPLRSAAR